MENKAMTADEIINSLGSMGPPFWKSYFPYIKREWFKTSVFLKDGTWEEATPKKPKKFYIDKEKKQQWWGYHYTNKITGESIPAKIYLERREWRNKYLKWTSLFNIVHFDIQIYFSRGVSSKSSTENEGTIICSYRVKKGETPLDCIKRMEQERIF